MLCCVVSCAGLFLFRKVRAADQTLTDEQRTEAREEAESEGRNAKYVLKEVSQFQDYRLCVLCLDSHKWGQSSGLSAFGIVGVRHLYAQVATGVLHGTLPMYYLFSTLYRGFPSPRYVVWSVLTQVAITLKNSFMRWLQREMLYIFAMYPSSKVFLWLIAC